MVGWILDEFWVKWLTQLTRILGEFWVHSWHSWHSWHEFWCQLCQLCQLCTFVETVPLCGRNALSTTTTTTTTTTRTTRRNKNNNNNKYTYTNRNYDLVPGSIAGFAKPINKTYLKPPPRCVCYTYQNLRAGVWQELWAQISPWPKYHNIAFLVDITPQLMHFLSHASCFCSIFVMSVNM